MVSAGQTVSLPKSSTQTKMQTLPTFSFNLWATLLFRSIDSLRSEKTKTYVSKLGHVKIPALSFVQSLQLQQGPKTTKKGPTIIT